MFDRLSEVRLCEVNRRGVTGLSVRSFHIGRSIRVVFTQAQAPHWEGACFRSAGYVGSATSGGVQTLCRFCANRETGMTPFAPRSAHSTRHSRAVFCCLREEPSNFRHISIRGVAKAALDCAHRPSPTGRRWREILNRGQNARKASVSGIGGKTRRVPQAARTSDVVRSTTLRSC